MSSHKSKRSADSKRYRPPAKGAYPLPDGTWVTQSVGKPDKRGARIGIRAIHRKDPDLRQLARAFVRLAEEQIRAEEERLGNAE